MSTIAAHGFGSTRRVRPAVRRPARPASSGAASLRLTRRGRLVLLAVFVLLACVAVGMVGGQSAATDEAGVPVKTRTVQVESGGTMWDIAATVAKPGEVREMVLTIQELNALSSPALVEGQKLAVPVR